MSDAPCRACGAAVPERAQWCSLCFADLREPAPLPVSAAVAQPPTASLDTVIAPQSAYGTTESVAIAPEAPTPALPAPAALSARVPAAAGATTLLAGTALDPTTPIPGTSQPPAGSTLVATAPAAARETGLPPAKSPAATTETVATNQTVATTPTVAMWPCPRCGEKVAIDIDECPSCGAGFLSGATQSISTKLPVVGDVTAMTPGQRWLVAMGISAALVVVLVVVLFLVGSVL